MKPYYQDEAVTIYHGDCREVLPALRCVVCGGRGERGSWVNELGRDVIGQCPDCDGTGGLADLVLTDPPYGIGERWAKSAMVGKNGASRLWGKGETWDDSTPEAELIAAAIAAGKQAIVWGGNYFGLPPARGWLVWDKIQTFTGADAELAWTNLDAPVRVFRMSRIEAYGANAEYFKEHPTEKPGKLMRWCLEKAGGEGLVIDPFAGSGSSLRAAKDLGRKAIGIELEEKYCEIAAQRCAQDVLDLGLAA